MTLFETEVNRALNEVVDALLEAFDNEGIVYTREMAITRIKQVDLQAKVIEKMNEIDWPK